MAVRYAFVCEGAWPLRCDAFLVKKDARGNVADYYFITAGHAVEDCRQPPRYLIEDSGQPRFESDGITRAAAPQRLNESRRLRRRGL